MSEEPSVREIRVGAHATQQQAEELKERIARLLCPDPDHAPPCPIPWSTGPVLHGSELDEGAYEELDEQARAERHLHQ
ncbi:hypothetical protein FHX42_003567 [Saccharopolyspora lacisalsi]|uniref:Uncharacterized protein n=1 Tax=Halosaccharopolyspora lacisalsi TaxID=1000566 RepID=A0A839E4A9_9PSEU|nr:hypothetical protein [Halosaccharopolyspora lacisalsi]MBA8826191.1 hypothetical protein [Halosaccharopolyspora lacisalsi]